MAATVSFLGRILNGRDAKDSGKPAAVITRNLLGGRFNSVVDDDDSEDQLDLDLDVHVPSGWEKRLDLKSGKVYIHKSCDSSKNQDKVNKDTAANSKLPSTKQPKMNSNMSESEEETNLNLNLLLSSAAAPSPVASSTSCFHNICTLDKVKSALERAEREDNAKNTRMKRRSASMMSSISSHSHSSSSVKVGDDLLMEEEEEGEEEKSSSAMYAASCPNCLLYVLVFKNNPKCPRCQITVPSPTATALVMKKPRIDLNISL